MFVILSLLYFLLKNFPKALDFSIIPLEMIWQIFVNRCIGGCCLHSLPPRFLVHPNHSIVEAAFWEKEHTRTFLNLFISTSNSLYLRPILIQIAAPLLNNLQLLPQPHAFQRFASHLFFIIHPCYIIYPSLYLTNSHLAISTSNSTWQR